MVNGRLRPLLGWGFSDTAASLEQLLKAFIATSVDTSPAPWFLTAAPIVQPTATAGHRAVQAGHLDIVRELVRAGADVAASVTNANTRCTAQAIALMNMNLQVWWYLKGKSSKKARSSGDVGGSSAAAAAVGGGDATASAQPKSFIPSRSPTANDIVNQIDNHDKAERALSWSEKRRVLDYAALRQDRQYMQLA